MSLAMRRLIHAAILTLTLVPLLFMKENLSWVKNLNLWLLSGYGIGITILLSGAIYAWRRGGRANGPAIGMYVVLIPACYLLASYIFSRGNSEIGLWTYFLIFISAYVASAFGSLLAQGGGGLPNRFIVWSITLIPSIGITYKWLVEGVAKPNWVYFTGIILGFQVITYVVINLLTERWSREMT